MSAYRHPRTLQELKWSQVEPDFPPRLRRFCLPTWYDDIPRTIQRSWKSFRNTQYKEAS